ncbi:hypothetical protein HmCmsJML285_5053 (plasmid) [Escherichia coli]|nr:hypothetical protein HmCmsJML285_5053 [Escherichia coli]
MNAHEVLDDCVIFFMKKTLNLYGKTASVKKIKKEIMAMNKVMQSVYIKLMGDFRTV